MQGILQYEACDQHMIPKAYHVDTENRIKLINETDLSCCHQYRKCISGTTNPPSYGWWPGDYISPELFHTRAAVSLRKASFIHLPSPPFPPRSPTYWPQWPNTTPNNHTASPRPPRRISSSTRHPMVAYRAIPHLHKLPMVASGPRIQRPNPIPWVALAMEALDLLLPE